MENLENSTQLSPHKNPYEYNGESIDYQLINENKHYDKKFYVESLFCYN